MPKTKDYLLSPSGDIPNNRRFALLVYEGCFPSDVTATEIQGQFRANGWGNSWVNGVFSYHHFHSNSHEVLGCFAGEATVQFGGEDGPKISISAGDAVLIPAGVGHKKLNSTPDFGVVGAYPTGSQHDLCTGEGDPDILIRNIASVARPDCDPITGQNGAMQEHWPLST